MYDYFMKVYYSITIMLLLVIYFIFLYSKNDQEDFFGGSYGPSYCDCNVRGQMGMNACLSCNNCGWCIDPNGNGSCVLGDQRGAYFADCVQYSYNGGIAASPYPTMMPWYQKFFVPWGGVVPPFFGGR